MQQFKLVALLCLSALLIGTHADIVNTNQAMSTFPINPTYVTTTSSVKSVSNTEVGTCICDLTVQKCDLNCRCDPDCTDAEKALFSSTANEGPTDTKISKCVNSDVLRANAKGSLTSNVVNNLLCIEQDNSPSKGFFLDSPTSLTSAQMAALIANNPYSYTTTSSSSPSSSSVSGTAFTTNSPIPRAFFTTDPNDLTALSPAYLIQPQSDLGGKCSDYNPVRFGVDTTTTCIRGSATPSVATSSPATACVAGGPYDANNHFNANVMVGTHMSAQPSNAGLYTPLMLNIAKRIDALGGETVLYNRSADATISLPTELVFITPTTNSSLFAFPTPTFNPADCTCSNALTSVHYHISYTTGGYVNVSLVDVTLGVVSAAASPSTPGTCLSELTYPQSWTSSFAEASGFTNYMLNVVSPSSTAAPSSTSSPSLSSSIPATGVRRSRSGAPGYRTGLPVLAGNVTLVNVTGDATTTELTPAIVQSVAGLTAMTKTALGACLPSSNVPSTNEYTHVIEFGLDTIFSCTLSLSLADLTSICSSVASTSTYLQPQSTYVGTWGNSSYMTIADWTAIDLASFPTSAPIFSPSARTCSDIVDTLEFTFATADFGSRSNPQRAIVAASTAYYRSTWTYTQPVTTTLQPFTLKVSVRFLHVTPSSVAQYVPSGPPLVPKLPADFLYPFYLGRSSAASLTTNALSTIGLIAVTVLSVMLAV